MILNSDALLHIYNQLIVIAGRRFQRKEHLGISVFVSKNGPNRFQKVAHTNSNRKEFFDGPYKFVTIFL